MGRSKKFDTGKLVLYFLIAFFFVFFILFVFNALDQQPEDTSEVTLCESTGGIWGEQMETVVMEGMCLEYEGEVCVNQEKIFMDLPVFACTCPNGTLSDEGICFPDPDCASGTCT